MLPRRLVGRLEVVARSTDVFVLVEEMDVSAQPFGLVPPSGRAQYLKDHRVTNR